MNMQQQEHQDIFFFLQQNKRVASKFKNVVNKCSCMCTRTQPSRNGMEQSECVVVCLCNSSVSVFEARSESKVEFCCLFFSS